MFNMINKDFFEKNKKILKDMSQYLILIILAIVLNIVGFFAIIRVVETEINKSNLLNIESMKSFYDSSFNQLSNITYNMLKSNSVRMLIGEKQTEKWDRITTIDSIVCDIKNNMYNHRMIEKFMIIVPDMDVVVDQTGTSDLACVYEKYFKQTFFSQQEWLNTIQSTKTERFIEVKQNNSQSVYMLYFLPTLKDKVVVMIKLDAKEINRLLQTSRANEYALIIDSKGTVLFSSEAEFLNKKSDFMLSAKRYTLNNEEMIVNCMESDFENLNYIRMVSAKELLKNVKRVCVAFVIGYLLSVLIGGAIAFAFVVHRNKKDEKMQQIMKKQMSYMQSSVLRQMLLHKIHAGEMTNEFFAEYNFSLNGKRLLVLSFDFEKITDEDDEEVFSYDSQTVCRYLENYFAGDEQYNVAYFCEINGIYAGVLGFSEKYTEMSLVKEQISALETRFCDEFHISFVCAVSMFFDSVSKLSDAYKQTVEIMNFRYLGSEDTVYVYDEISDGFKYKFDSKEEMQLSNLILLGDSAETTNYINTLFNYTEDEKRLNMNSIRIFTMDIIRALMKAEKKFSEDANIDFRELLLMSNDINSVRQIKRIKKMITDIANELCELSKKRKTNQMGDSKCRQIIEFIEQNYSDSMLNVNMIADTFHMNQSWLSTIFKERMGEGLASYIVKFRFEKAKQLLKTDKSISQIAVEAGFSNVDVFRRAFKKFEGITPIQYRQMLDVKE